MTDAIEFYASTIDGAVEKAALELGLSPKEVAYRVLDEGNSGFLGIGARDARIIVEAPAQPNRDEEDGPLETTPAETAVVNEPESAPSEKAGRNARSSTLSEVYGVSSGPEQVEASGELLDEIRVLVTSVLDAMGFEARVEVYDAGGLSPR